MKLFAAVILSVLLASMPPAFARTVGVHVFNDDSQDLDVTVTDQNQSGQVVYNQRLAQKTEVFLELQADPGGEASLDWKAVTTGTPPAAACGRKSGLRLGDIIKVTSNTGFGTSASIGSTRPQSAAISNPVP